MLLRESLSLVCFVCVFFLPVTVLYNLILPANDPEFSRTTITNYRTATKAGLYPYSRTTRRQGADFHNQHLTQAAIPTVQIASDVARQSLPGVRNSLSAYRTIALS